MPSAADYIQNAAKIADDEISIDQYGDYLSVSYSSQVMNRIEELINLATTMEPDNAEYKYWLYCAQIGSGKLESGIKNIKELSLKHPGYIDLLGHAMYPDKWFSPFYYPSWNDKTAKVPVSLISLPEGGTSLISLRDGLRRIVSFFRKADRSFITGLRKNISINLKFNYMKTPYSNVAGCYLLINDNKNNPHVSETIINVDSCPTQIRDMSNAGHWLLRILAQQSYSYIILWDPATNMVFNKKLYFSASIKHSLRQLKLRIESLSPTPEFDPQSFQKARQYYMDNFSLDDVLRNI